MSGTVGRGDGMVGVRLGSLVDLNVGVRVGMLVAVAVAVGAGAGANRAAHAGIPQITKAINATNPTKPTIHAGDILTFRSGNFPFGVSGASGGAG